MPLHPWRPRITYGTVPTVINLTLPMGIWGLPAKSHGGSRVVDAGAVATFRKRRDRMLATPLHVLESEYTAIMTWIDWCHDNGTGPYTFRPDQLVATDFQMYLVTPALNEEWEPRRHEEDAGVWVFDILHRRTTDSIINLPALL